MSSTISPVDPSRLMDLASERLRETRGSRLGDVEGGPVGPAFGQVVEGFLGQVNESQQKADAMVEALALGEPVDVHQVMLALNEASNALQVTLQVRSKILDAYQ